MGRIMAVTKIHPIKTTLKKAIDYICNGDKTDDEIYVTTHLCSRKNAHKEFDLTKKHNSLASQYEELEHLKNNMNKYLGRDKTEKNESVIGAIKKYKRKIDKTIEQSHSMSNDMEL